MFRLRNARINSNLRAGKAAPNHRGLAVSSYGRTLLYGRNEVVDSDIMLVRNFR
jgi:hypothetical protein